MCAWLEPQEVSIHEDLQATVGGHPLVAQVLAQRGVASPQAARAFLNPDHYTPSSPTDLPGMALAADRLVEAIHRREAICVWGDFDADGQTATTVLVSTLRDLGAEVTYHIPVRERESHGVNLPVLEQIIAGGARLVLTCDTGITAHAAVDYARARGVDFIVTDHHELPPALPEAVAVINPRLLPARHPLGTLPGVGVAYKLAEELYRRFGREGSGGRHADLAALGIVADLAIQTGEARYLVQRGLERLRKPDRLGLKVLMETADLNPAGLTETHIGFVLGPRLNAVGRLADANQSVELLTTQDLGRARVLATTLEGLNAHRQLLTNQVFEAAMAQLQRDPALLDEPALVLSHLAWPAGVIGIVASRLVERYHRPTVVIASPPGEMARGSARSVEGCNITAALAAHQELLANFGGHPMAAGFAIDPERIPELRRGLARTVREMVGDVLLGSDLQIDGYLSLAELSLDFVEDLQRLAPFGPGNPALVLATRNLTLQSHTTLGRNEEHLQLIVADEHGNTQKVLWWQGAGGEIPQGRFDLAYNVRASDYRGFREVQIEWVEVRPLEEPLQLKAAKRSIAAVDYRQQTFPITVLKQLVVEHGAQVWGEAEAVAKLAELGIAGRDRYALAPARELAVWTTPPGRNELQAAVERVAPEVIYLFGVDPETTNLDLFLKRLAGLVKHALNAHQGEAELSRLAAATGQREETVRKGLDWLAARGHLLILSAQEDRLKLGTGSQNTAPDLEVVAARLKSLMNETSAFRAYFRKADKDRLISPGEE